MTEAIDFDEMNRSVIREYQRKTVRLIPVLELERT